MNSVKTVLQWTAIIVAAGLFFSGFIWLVNSDVARDDQNFRDFCHKLGAVADTERDVCIKHQEIVYTED